MRIHCLLLLLALAASAPVRAEEKTRVVVTLPYLGEVARAVGGDLAEVEVLAPLEQDPHFIVPTPARAVALSRADVFIENGVQLELWAERIIDLARNQQIRPGYPGHTYAATGIRTLQVPRNQSRAAGDVHPAGNPHVWLDPLNLILIAKNVEQVLARVRPGGAKTFANNQKAFARRLREAYYGPELLRLLGPKLLDKLKDQGKLFGFLREKTFKKKPLSDYAGGWLKRALALEGLTLISYHQVWIYFETAFGLRVVGTLEEKPGIPPSPGHLDDLVGIAAAHGTKVVVSAPFYPFSRAQGLAERIGGVAVVLPTEPGEQGTQDLWDLFDTIFDRLEEAAKATRR
ncbi:MAG: zinc ABC transporter substrate-binding protein [Planctomycetota bacterium]|nr:MAG: zinc ABC transporter substrate-binding protein [Planctomycetota bacterium]